MRIVKECVSLINAEIGYDPSLGRPIGRSGYTYVAILMTYAHQLCDHRLSSLVSFHKRLVTADIVTDHYHIIPSSFTVLKSCR